ncbi:nucleic acid-binding protein, partial [Enterobacter kobei]|uniref:nucleic acid-binding protein n=2 Tax=Enterobacterales TaxID=91347 RepID=UPI003BF70061
MTSLKYELMSELKQFTRRKTNEKREARILQACKDLKTRFVNQGKQDEAKNIWCLENALLAQNMYIKFINLLYREKFYKAWCLLEQCEIKLENLKRHFPQTLCQEVYLDFLYHQVPLWQKVFPYRIFNSTEYLEKKIVCSTCKSPITPRNFCGHDKGEIYDGEICYRIIEDFEIIGFAMVKNPVNKYGVPFKKDENGKTIDQYNYKCVKMILRELPSLFYWWEINKKFDWHHRSEFHNTAPEDHCPCGADRIFKDCCSHKPVILTPHIEIVPLR